MGDKDQAAFNRWFLDTVVTKHHGPPTMEQVWKAALAHERSKSDLVKVEEASPEHIEALTKIHRLEENVHILTQALVSIATNYGRPTEMMVTARKTLQKIKIEI